MDNYEFLLNIKPKDIYNKLLPKQKELFDHIQITDATLCDDNTVKIKCLALANKNIEFAELQSLLGDGYISVV